MCNNKGANLMSYLRRRINIVPSNSLFDAVSLSLVDILQWVLEFGFKSDSIVQHHTMNFVSCVIYMVLLRYFGNAPGIWCPINTTTKFPNGIISYYVILHWTHKYGIHFQSLKWKCNISCITSQRHAHETFQKNFDIYYVLYGIKSCSKRLL